MCKFVWLNENNVFVRIFARLSSLRRSATKSVEQHSS